MKQKENTLTPTLCSFVLVVALILWLPLQLSAEALPNNVSTPDSQTIPDAIARFKLSEQQDFMDIGTIEILKYQCLDLNAPQKSNLAENLNKTINNTKEKKITEQCVVLWQWMDTSTWSVALSIIDDKGKELDSVSFGRSAMLLDIVPYSKGSLILVEHAVQQGGDVSCCPSKVNISVYRWFKGQLQQLSQGELAETNRHP